VSTYTLTQPAADVWLDGDGAGGQTDNQGAHPKSYFGFDGASRKMRTLQRWDFSSISAAETVTSVTLNLTDTDWALRTANNAINIYKVSDANGDWVEGTTLDIPQTGSPCWNTKVTNTVNWAGSAGLSTAGTDYVNTSLASYTFVDGTSGVKSITFNSDGIAVVQSWLGGAGGNGILIIGDESTGGSWTEIASKEDATPSNRPQLVIVTSGGSGLALQESGWSPLEQQTNPLMVSVW
jgi:hypothetical protein